LGPDHLHRPVDEILPGESVKSGIFQNLEEVFQADVEPRVALPFESQNGVGPEPDLER
jgi:hypothetical protein